MPNKDEFADDIASIEGKKDGKAVNTFMSKLGVPGSEDEFAADLAKMPAYTAQQSLASRGLTPDMVRNGQGVSQAPSLASDLGFTNIPHTLWEGVKGIADVPAGVYNTFRHPIDNFYTAPQKRMQVASDYAQQGDVYNTVVHSLAAGVPFGASAPDIAEGITTNMPRAMGQAVGTAVFPEVVKKTPSIVKNAKPLAAGIGGAVKGALNELPHATTNAAIAAAPHIVTNPFGWKASTVAALPLVRQLGNAALEEGRNAYYGAKASPQVANWQFSEPVGPPNPFKDGFTGYVPQSELSQPFAVPGPLPAPVTWEQAMQRAVHGGSAPLADGSALAAEDVVRRGVQPIENEPQAPQTQFEATPTKVPKTRKVPGSPAVNDSVAVKAAVDKAKLAQKAAAQPDIYEGSTRKADGLPSSNAGKFSGPTPKKISGGRIKSKTTGMPSDTPVGLEDQRTSPSFSEKSMDYSEVFGKDGKPNIGRVLSTDKKGNMTLIDGVSPDHGHVSIRTVNPASGLVSKKIIPIRMMDPVSSLLDHLQKLNEQRSGMTTDELLAKVLEHAQRENGHIE